MTAEVQAGSVGEVETRVKRLSRPVRLEAGGYLSHVEIAYEIYGTLAPARDNAILVCHALSGDAHAAGWRPGTPSAVDGFGAEDKQALPGLGWWDGLIGPGRALDTDTYCVICSNVIGSCRGSTGPASLSPATGRPYGSSFPVVTVGDMVRAQRLLLDELDIPRLRAAIGGSLGGMQSLEWALEYPDRIDAVILTASTARLGAQGLAWNAIARSAIMADPNWQGGDYLDTTRRPDPGLGVARMVGHVTYLSQAGMAERFGRRLQERDAYSYTLDNPDFAVESYLRHQAETFPRRFDANSYLYLSRALTYFDAARAYGRGSLPEAVRRIRAETLLISFDSDWLYPTSDSIELESALRAAGKSVERHELSAPYGHDSFLLQTDQQTSIIRHFLAHLAA
ncbi:MAG TPA: homoserine O-acetyltransferase [Chloroflexota bacterium]|nr:homoserine O-acetyltransferase [Chloroflexota bacterium]